MQDVSLLFFKFGDFDSLIVHIDVFTRNLPAFIDLRDLSITGIFDGIDFVPAKKLDQKTVEILRTCADDDLFWGDTHPPKFFQIVGNGFSEGKNAAAGRIGHQLHLAVI